MGISCGHRCPPISILKFFLSSDFASKCTEKGKFSCASSGLCLSKDIFHNNFKRIDLNCTPTQGGPCLGDPCGDHGICYEGKNEVFCGCNPGWQGKTCDEESKL